MSPEELIVKMGEKLGMRMGQVDTTIQMGKREISSKIELHDTPSKRMVCVRLAVVYVTTDASAALDTRIAFANIQQRNSKETMGGQPVR